MSTPTPRTDAVVEEDMKRNKSFLAEDLLVHAYTLERELVTEQAYISALEDQLDAYGLAMARKQAGKDYKL